MSNKLIITFSPFSTIVVFVLLMLIGLFVLPKLSFQLSPSRTYGSAIIECEMPGATSEIVEISVCSVLERVVSRLKGITEISSVSSESRCRINVKLDKWTNPEFFRFEASLLLRQISRKLPQEASYPTLTLDFNNNDLQNGSFLGFALSGPGEINEVAQLAGRIIRPALVGLKGLEKIEIQGAQPQKVRVKIDNKAAEASGVNNLHIRQALKNALRTEFIGTFSNSNEQTIIFIDKGNKNLDFLSLLPISSRSGRIIRLSQVAKIEKEAAPRNSFYRINGQEVVSIALSSDKKANQIELAKEIKEKLANATLQLPESYRFVTTYDNTEHLVKEINKIYFRTGLSLLILLSFIVISTRRIQYILIVLSTLFANVLISCIFYYLFNIGIHLYSLAGITLSLGLVVDNSIVVVEDIVNTGKKRILRAIFASTLLSISALLAIFLLEEQQQILLWDFGLTIVVNLIVSIPIAWFMVPALLNLFLSRNTSKISSKSRKIRQAIKWNLILYRNFKFIVVYRVYILLLFIWAFGIPFFLLPDRVDDGKFLAGLYNNTIGSEFYNSKVRDRVNNFFGGTLYLFMNSDKKYLPTINSRNNTQINVNITTIKGTTVAQINNVVKTFETFLTNNGANLEFIESFVFNANHARIMIYFKEDCEKNSPYVIKDLLEELSIKEGAADFQVYGVGKGFDNTINLNRYDSSISIKGYEYRKLQELANELKDSLKTNPRVQDVILSTTAQKDFKTFPEFQSKLKAPRVLSLNGISLRDIRNSISNLSSIDEYIGSIIEENGNSSDVTLVSYADQNPSLWSILNDQIVLNDSVTSKFNGLGNLEWIRKSENIHRVNQEYILHIHYKFLGSFDLDNKLQRRIIKNYEDKLPFGYKIVLNEYGNKWSFGSNRYLWLIPLILVIVFIICAILLESLTKPFAVISIIPFSFIGVFVIFYLLNLGLDEGSYASLLLVSALVTNTALYIINDFNFLKKGNKTDIEVYSRAFNSKIMPIIITTSSAVLSLLPFMINGDDQGFWFTLSAGTIGGLVFSVIAAYLLLPICLIKRKKIIKNNV